jgi:solute carrier family 35 (adenosine 3'-phospho 5'-phosphosulfate transporter), member B2
MKRTGATDIESGSPHPKEDKDDKNEKILDDDSDSKKDKDDPQSRSLKLIGCFVGIQVSYVLWGVAQEQIMTRTYKLGKFKSSTFCVFGNRLLALLISMCVVMYNRYTKPKMYNAPSSAYIPSSLSNSISSWAQYEALKYLSFPSQVLSKSCKIIPVMLVGILLNNKSYPMIEYIEALSITAGVALFTFSQKPAPEEDKADSMVSDMIQS